MRLYPVIIIGFAIFFGGCAASPDHGEWSQGFGGVINSASTTRGQQIADRLAVGLVGCRLHVEILRTASVSAFSFPDGSIFLTQGLMVRASDDEVAAAIAHELGHMLSDGHLQGPSALRGSEKGLDVESNADAVGCRVLEMHGVSAVNMTNMLQLVVSDSCSRQCRDDLAKRICRLQFGNAVEWR